ncbi:MAG: DUF2273 domain-containing protein [Oscillospiraceae bacterium]
MSFLTRFFPEAAKPYAGRIIMTLFGLIIAILFLTIGFWRTLLILILSAAGYLLGKWEDGALDTSRLPIPGRWR